MSITSKKTYSSVDLANHFGLKSDSSVRKWCLKMEEEGYQFTKNRNGKRVFKDEDIMILGYFRELVQERRMSLENAALIVVNKFQPKQRTHEVPLLNLTEKDEVLIKKEFSIIEKAFDEIISEQVTPIVKKLLFHIEQQGQFNQQLLERLDKQQEQLEERLEEKSKMTEERMFKRDEVLMEVIRGIQRSNEPKRKNRGFWGKFFGL